MHIAVCDDNVADRKQMERLLKREADRRASSSDGFYIDSFGNVDFLLHNPMQYDVFYIDICCTEGITGADVVRLLSAKGVNTPMVLCCSRIDYQKQSFSSNVFFLMKPVKVEELSFSIDYALTVKASALPLIELRMESDTIYVTEPDILYAVGKGRNITVTLSDGRKIIMANSIDNFLSQLESHKTFFDSRRKLLINGRHIKELKYTKAVMSDGAVFRLGISDVKYAKYFLKEYC